MNGNFGSLERRIGKLEEVLANQMAEPLDASNLFDLECFTDEERRAWASFWQHVGASFTTGHDGKSINLRGWPDDDLKILKRWILLYKERTTN